jgi:hypothetical protein
MDGRMSRLLTRQEALQRRALKQAWGCVALGLLIPMIALLAVYNGWSLRDSRPGHAWPLIGVGLTVFTVRLALYLG